MLLSNTDELIFLVTKGVSGLWIIARFGVHGRRVIKARA